jgi:3-methyladenine DNA glycosylase AlkD
MNASFDQVLMRLYSLENPANAAGMARFGIHGKHVLGISVVELRRIARELGKDQPLALELWESGVHEARILASMVADPKQLTEAQMDQWVNDFDTWDICDQCCSNLFDRSPLAYIKAVEWSEQSAEFVRRAGFALMACLAAHDKKAPDAAFEPFFKAIQGRADDERNYVKKAANWALRQIGKRNRALCGQALHLTRELSVSESSSARWIGKDALRELNSPKIQQKLNKTRMG